jgi:predicted phage baseplate assembly protein
MDLAFIEARGNLIPATAGETFTAYFITGADLNDFTPAEQLAMSQPNGQTAYKAVERIGPDGSVAYLFTLPGSESTPLVWLGVSVQVAFPEVILQEMTFNQGTSQWVIASEWEWRRSLLGVNSSQSEDLHFTLDDGSWRQVVRFQRSGEEFIHQDYAEDKGATIRFGDGEFGRVPSSKSVFRVYYRLGGGSRSNVSTNSLRHMSPLPPFVLASTNPIHAFGGIDAESPNELRQLAPEAFRALTFRAVRPEDYAEAAERLPWVQHAGAVFRWTGSWLSAFVTPDPRGTTTLQDERRIDLIRQLDRFRQAGREVNVLSPEYADLDLEIEICISPGAYFGEVKKRLLEILIGKKGVIARRGYFSADKFTFGTPLSRSSLEAAIQSVHGVHAVLNILYRRRGWFDWRPLVLSPYDPGMNAIIRVENDPFYPERGSVKIKT